MTDLNIGDPIQVTIKLFDPSRDSDPRYKTYTVPYTREMRILEALDYIVEELGESLAYHWFCGVKKCGMCGMLVNGRPVLSCWEAVQSEMILEPLPHFPVIRDLVVDRCEYNKNLIAMHPLMVREKGYTQFPEPLKHTEMKLAAEMMHCIECMLCVSTCPAYGNGFVGPAPLVQLARFAMDPRDEGLRAKTAVSNGGIDQCISCYQCSLVCPAGINVYENAISGLARKAREQKFAKRPSLRSRFFADIHSFSKIGSAFAPFSNWVVSLRISRWLLEKVMKIDHRRPLPKFTRLTFEKWFHQRTSKNSSDKKVLLFHDTFANYIETEVAIAATEVLEAFGFEVLIDEKRKCCGRPMLSKGMEKEARDNAQYNIKLLVPYARKGIPIIGLEPSCILTIREDYMRLVPGEDSVLLSQNTYTFDEFIDQVAVKENPDLSEKFTQQKRKFLLHGHCHQKALTGTASTLRALTLPPHYQAAEIPSGCCGMAGSFGFESEHFNRSLQAAEEILFPTIRNADKDLEIVAPGMSCRQQITQGTGRHARHPAIVLRDALQFTNEK